MDRILILLFFWAFSFSVYVGEEALAKEPMASATGRMTLHDALQQALKHSPQIEISKATISSATGAVEQAASLPNPEVGVNVENAGGTGSYKGLSSAEITYGISQTIEMGGKRQARMSAAEAAKNTATLQAKANELILLKNVTVAFMELSAAIHKKELAEEQKRLAESIKNNVSERVKAAREPKIQESKAEVSYATSVINLSKSGRELSVAQKNLSMLIGSEVGVENPATDEFISVVAPNPLESYQAKLKTSPELLLLHSKISENEGLLDIEKAAAIPDPTLNVGMRDYKDSGDQAFVVGVSIPIPVFNQNSGNIHKAGANVVQAQGESIQGNLMLSQQLETAWRQWQTSYNEVATLKMEIIPEAEEAFALARQSYQLGKFPYLEVLDAQRTLFDAKAQYFDALLSAQTAKAEVKQLTGDIENEDLP